MSDWTPVEQVAKDDNGNYMALVGGKWVPALGGAKNDAGEYVAQLQQQIPQATEKPWYDKGAEFLLGEGPTKNMSFGDRIERIGKAGLTGAAVGAGIGGGVGSLAGGVGAAPGALAGGGLGGIAGMLGEAGSQATQAFGGGRALQGATELAAGGMTEPIVKAVPALSRFVASKVLGLGGSRLLGEVTPGMENDSTIRQAVANARQGLMSGRDTGAMSSLGGLFQEADTSARQATQQAIEAATQRANAVGANALSQAESLIAKNRASATASNVALEQQHAAAEQARNAAQRELQTTQEAGLGKGESLYSIGDWLRNRVLGKYVPALQKSQETYGAAKDAAMASAKELESTGQYWAATPEAQAIKQKWLDSLGNREDSASRDVRNLINQIWGEKTITKEVVDEVASAQAGTPIMKTIQEKVPSYASAEKIDDIVRKLGEAYGKDSVTGFDAIKQGLAKQLRKDLTHGADNTGAGGFYEWSGLGPAKTAYKEALEANSAIKNKLGDTLIAKDADRGTFINNPEKVLKESLSSTDSLNKLVQLTGPQDAADTISKYAVSSIQGKSPAEVRTWLAEHAHLKESNVGKSAYAAVEDYSRRLSGHESTIAKADQAISGIKSRYQTEDVLSAFEKTTRAAAEAEKKAALEAATEGNKKLETQLRTTGLFGGATEGSQLVNPASVGEKLFSGNVTKDGLEVIGGLLAKDPKKNGKLVYDAAAQHLSRVSPDNLPASLDNVLHLLDKAGFANPEQAKALRTGVENIIKSSKGQFDKTAALQAMFKRAWQQNIPAAVGGQEGIRLFDAFKKDKQQ